MNCPCIRGSAFFVSPSFSRPLGIKLGSLVACFILLFSASAAFAQNPQVPKGGTLTFPSTGTNTANNGARLHWEVDDPSYADVGNSTNPRGWSVTSSNVSVGTTSADLTVTAPSTATVGTNYSVTFCTTNGGSISTGQDGWFGPYSAFDVITPPAAKPAGAAGPAFPWQGAVGGVNTGNGNKMTVLPLTGWTMRGGMAVSCALIHNSQNSVSTPFGMPYGNKWLASYQSWLSKDGAGNVTVQ